MSSIPSAVDSGAAPRLLEQVRGRIRFLHYSLRTEQAYLDWIKRFIRHFGKRHPREMGAVEVEAFLTHLAVVGNVAVTDTMSVGGKTTAICVGSRRSGASGNAEMIVAGRRPESDYRVSRRV